MGKRRGRAEVDVYVNGNCSKRDLAPGIKQAGANVPAFTRMSGGREGKRSLEIAPFHSGRRTPAARACASTRFSYSGSSAFAGWLAVSWPMKGGWIE